MATLIFGEVCCICLNESIDTPSKNNQKSLIKLKPDFNSNLSASFTK